MALLLKLHGTEPSEVKLTGTYKHVRVRHEKTTRISLNEGDTELASLDVAVPPLEDHKQGQKTCTKKARSECGTLNLSYNYKFYKRLGQMELFSVDLSVYLLDAKDGSPTADYCKRQKQLKDGYWEERRLKDRLRSLELEREGLPKLIELERRLLQEAQKTLAGTEMRVAELPTEINEVKQRLTQLAEEMQELGQPLVSSWSATMSVLG